MNPWNESFELLKSIDDSNDLDKGVIVDFAIGAAKGGWKKLKSLLKKKSESTGSGAAAQGARINPNVSTWRGGVRRKWLLKQEKLTKNYDALVQKLKDNPDRQLNLDEVKILESKGVLPPPRVPPELRSVQGGRGNLTREDLVKDKPKQKERPAYEEGPKERKKTWWHNPPEDR